MKLNIVKKTMILTMLTSLLMTCGSCGSKKQAGTSEGVGWKENAICAVVFLGYGSDFTTLSTTNNFKTFAQRLPSLQKMTEFTVKTEGDEVYFIIPRYANATITVNEYQLNIESGKEIIGKKLYQGDAEPILLKCNLSDLHPNTSVTITGNRESVTFNPQSSCSSKAGVQYLSLNDVGDEEEEAFPTSLPTEFTYKGYAGSIRAKVSNGKVSLFFDRKEAAEIMGDKSFTPESSYEIEGLSGECKGVHIGDVGQDYNPVLACLLEDGGIEVIALYEALRTHDFRTSGRLPGYDNMVSVINDAVIFEEEGGGYGTLFAISEEGFKKEIEFCVQHGKYVHYSIPVTSDEDAERMCYILTLTFDWKFSYMSGYANSEAMEYFVGRCWKANEKYTNNDYLVVYNYEMKEADRSEMTGIAPDNTLRTGAFKARLTGDRSQYLHVICTKGLRFHPGNMGTEAIFNVER